MRSGTTDSKEMKPAQSLAEAGTQQAPRRVAGGEIVQDGIIAGNVTDKYGTSNPLYRRLMDRFLSTFLELLNDTGIREVHEVGCGEGHLALEMVQRGYTVRGTDFSDDVIATAQMHARQAGQTIDFEVASVYDLTPERHAAPCVVCCEVLEHLERPDDALAVLAKLAQPHLIVSVPREPVWRMLNMARGKYWCDFGNTPGHLQHWSQRGFVSMLERYVEVVEVRAPLPWTMVRCRVR